MLQKTKYALCDVGIIFNTYGVEGMAWLLLCLIPPPNGWVLFLIPMGWGDAFSVYAQRLGMNFNTRVGRGVAIRVFKPQNVGYYF